MPTIDLAPPAASGSRAVTPFSQDSFSTVPEWVLSPPHGSRPYVWASATSTPRRAREFDRLDRGTGSQFLREMVSALRNSRLNEFASPLEALGAAVEVGSMLEATYPEIAARGRIYAGPAGSIEMQFSMPRWLLEITTGPGVDNAIAVYTLDRQTGIEAERECSSATQVIDEIAKFRAT